MKRSHAGGNLWLGGIAAAAMLAAHWLAYLISVPGRHAREHLLEDSGHGYWAYAMPLAAAACAVGLVGFIRRGLLDGDPGGVSKLRFFLGAGLRLLVLQTATFTLLESGERVLGGHGAVLESLIEPVFFVGIALQAVAAFVIALLLAALAYVTERVSRSACTLDETTTESTPLISLVAAPRLRPIIDGPALRGPPAIA